MLQRFWHRLAGDQSLHVCNPIYRPRREDWELKTYYRADWLVKLDGSSDRRTVCRLCLERNDTSWCFHQRALVHSPELPNLSPDDLDHAHSRVHQQHAYQVDRQFQLCRINIQYHFVVYCAYPHTGGDEQGGTRAPSIHQGKHRLGQLL